MKIQKALFTGLVASSTFRLTERHPESLVSLKGLINPRYSDMLAPPNKMILLGTDFGHSKDYQLSSLKGKSLLIDINEKTLDEIAIEINGFIKKMKHVHLGLYIHGNIYPNDDFQIYNKGITNGTESISLYKLLNQLETTSDHSVLIDLFSCFSGEQKALQKTIDQIKTPNISIRVFNSGDIQDGYLNNLVMKSVFSLPNDFETLRLTTPPSAELVLASQGKGIQEVWPNLTIPLLESDTDEWLELLWSELNHAVAEIIPHVSQTMTKESIERYIEKISIDSRFIAIHDKLIDKIMNDDNIDKNVNVDGFRPLIEAIQTDNLSYLKALVHYPGIDLHQSTAYGVTALHLAVSLENFSAARILLSHKEINPNIKNSNQNTPLHNAISSPNCLELLLSHPSILPNQQSINGNTPLYDAAYFGYDNAVKSLLAHPLTDPNLLTHGGYSPLHISIIRNNLETLSLLLKNKKVDSTLSYNYLISPIVLAILIRNNDALKILIDHGKNDPSQKFLSFNNIYFALGAGNLEAIRLLWHAAQERSSREHSSSKSSLEL